MLHRFCTGPNEKIINDFRRVVNTFPDFYPLDSRRKELPDYA